MNDIATYLNDAAESGASAGEMERSEGAILTTQAPVLATPLIAAAFVCGAAAGWGAAQAAG